MSDLSGQKFNCLRVLECVGKRHRYKVYQCVCVCGKETVVRSTYLRTGHTKSCGCRATEGSRKHSHARRGRLSSTYISWRAMKARCLNPKHKAYKNYGGRGITIDPAWLGPGGFQQFLADLGPRRVGTSLERVNNDGNYCKDNCKWATRPEQQLNKRPVLSKVA